MNVQCQCFV
jgi:hypothetical protein